MANFDVVDHVMCLANPICFEKVAPPDWLNLLQIENQTHGYVDLVSLAAVVAFDDYTNLKKKKKRLKNFYVSRRFEVSCA